MLVKVPFEAILSEGLTKDSASTRNSISGGGTNGSFIYPHERSMEREYIKFPRTRNRHELKWFMRVP